MFVNQYWFEEELWAKFLTIAKECNETSFQNYIFSPSVIEFIEINVIEEDLITKNEFEEILHLLRKIKKDLIKNKQ